MFDKKTKISIGVDRTYGELEFGNIETKAIVTTLKRIYV